MHRWNKILLLISHSQDFMNTVCTHMVNFTRKSLVYYTGNYDQFVKVRLPYLLCMSVMYSCVCILCTCMILPGTNEIDIMICVYLCI